MKEAFGGIYSILFIAIFLVIVIGVLGFVVSYTKAFRMKSDIIYTIERYEGSCCGGGNEAPDFTTYSSAGCEPQLSACREKIVEKAQDLGYNPVSLNCPDGYVAATYNGDEYPSYKNKQLFCYKIYSTDIDDGKGRRVYYSVITQVDINFPIVENILGMRIFQVSGDTRAIRLQDGKKIG